MKKLILAAILLASLNVNAQKKDTTVHQQMDTVNAGYRVFVILDSIQYQNMYTFLSRLPIENDEARYIFDLVSGKLKNLVKDPINIVRPKKKK